MKTLRFTLMTLVFSVFVVNLFAQGNMTIQGGGAVTVNGNTYIIPMVFTCGSPFIDSRDGHVYNTVQIGSQCWMKQNLNYGTRINGITEQSNNNIAEKYCFNNDENNCDVYGGLYQWGEMVQYINGATNTTSWNPVPTGNIVGICPVGWHIPSYDEWTTLENFLGGESIAGGKMKETGTTHWFSPNIGATNSSGFTALPGGIWGPGYFYCIRCYANFWSTYQTDATPTNATTAFIKHLGFDFELMEWNNCLKSYAPSVRCIKD